MNHHKTMIAELTDKRSQRAREVRRLVDRARASNRSLTITEAREFDAAETEIRELDDRIEELSAQVAADEAAAPLSRRYAGTDNTNINNGAHSMIERNNNVMPGTPRVMVTSHEEIYRPDNGHSFFRDLYSSRHNRDDAATDRLRKNNQLRAINTTNGTGGEFSPPLWLEDQFIRLARPGRVAVDLTNVQPMPNGTDTLILPKVATGTTVGIQAGGQNQPISQTDITTTSVSSPVTTLAGGQTVALQLLEQSPLNIDNVILGDLAAAYGAAFDAEVLNGSGTGGHLTGLMNIAGRNTVDFTMPTGTPTTAQIISALYSKLANAIQLITTQRYLPPDAIIMSPRRWAWLTAASDASNRPLVVPNAVGPFNAVGVSGDVAAQGYVGSLLGLPVYVDSQIPINLSADSGSGEDAIVVARMADLWSWESSVKAEAFAQTYANNLSVFVRLYSYVGFVGARYPQSISVITGSGLTAPTF